MPVTPQRKLEQRGKVLVAARKCFLRHGFHATGMAEIAKSCRMSVGNIYHYFPHKNAIVQAITDDIRSRIMPACRSIEHHSNPVDGLVELMLLSVRVIYNDSNARLWMEILAEVPRNKSIRKVCHAFDHDLREAFKRLINRGVNEGELPSETDLEATSLWLMAMLDGAIARLSAQPDLDLEQLERTLARNLRRFFTSPVAA